MSNTNGSCGCEWVREEGFAAWERLARVGCWRWRRETDEPEWSAEMFRITGWAEAAGAPRYGEWESMCTGDSWVRLAWALEQGLETGEGFGLELEFVRPDGGRVWGLLRAEAERDGMGEVVGLRGTLQDVTAWREGERGLRQAKEAAEATARRKSEFLAGMSNGIRTPLNGIVGMTSLLMQTELTGEQRDGLEGVRASSETLLAVLNDVLDFAKIEAGRLEIERVPFALERMVEDAIDAVGDEAARKGLELQFFVSGELPAALLGDSLRLRQVLLNFLTNAIKYTDEGAVTVLVEPDDCAGPGIGVRFTVNDTGVGLTAAERERVFRREPELSASGAGLGLCIAGRLVEMMGGEAGVESRLGEGSTFWFTARLGECPVPLPAPVSQEALTGGRLLVVGDQDLGLLLIRQQVEALGMQMTTARGEDEACAAVERDWPEEDDFRAVLVDVDMAGLDPAALVRRMRARSAAALLPVVFLCAVRDQRLMTEAAGMGSAALLVKPLRKAALARVLCGMVRGGEGEPGAAGGPRAREGDAGSVLLANGNETGRKLGALMLRRLGYRVRVVEDAGAAVAVALEARYDAVLLDCQMDGAWDAAREIRRREREGERMLLLGLTGNEAASEVERCWEAGMDDVIAAPLTLDGLREKLSGRNGGAREPAGEYCA